MNTIKCKTIMEALGNGYVITFRQGHQKLVQFKDVFELCYEYDDVDNWIVLRTKFGNYQAPYKG